MAGVPETLELLRKFHSLGYELYLQGGDVRCRYTGANFPPRNRTAPLLEELKRLEAPMALFLRQAADMELNERMCIIGEYTDPVS